MNIKEFFQKKESNNRYASQFRRAIAAGIDMWVVLFLRIIFIQGLAFVYLNQALLNFREEFKDKFGTSIIKQQTDHIEFIVNHKFFFFLLLTYAFAILIGAVYHAILNSSAWRGTLGKRITSIMLVEKNDSKISFNKGIAHYFLSILPFVFILYIMISANYHKDYNILHIITNSNFNIFLAIIFVFWTQINFFTKRKVTAYDIICKTIIVNGRTSAKLPWTKEI